MRWLRHHRALATTLAASVVAALAVAGSPAAQADTWTAPVLSRLIGGPSSPQVYAWGTAFNATTGEVLVTDYVNKTVRRYSQDGDYLGNSNGPTDAGLYAGIAVDPRDGSFYVGTQQGTGGKILKFTSNATFLYAIDPPGLTTFVAVDQAGYVYANQRTTAATIDKLAVDDATKSYTVVASFSAAGGSFYADLEVASDGRVYAVQQDQYRVRVFAADGALLSSFGVKGAGPGKFRGDMRGLAVDEPRNRVYVVDAEASQVEVFTLDGAYVATLGSGMGQGPGQFQDGGRQVTVGVDGTVWVADYGNFRIVPFAADGGALMPFPSPAVEPDTWGFNSLMDVAVDPVDGAVLGVDSYNQRYHRFSSTGELVGVWGRRGNNPPYGFNYPKGIGIDPATRNVWVTHQEVGKPDITIYAADGSYLGSVAQTRPDAVAFYGGQAYVLAQGTVVVRDAATWAETRRWSAGSRNLGIDPGNGDVYLPTGGSVGVYTSAGTYRHSLSGGSSFYDAAVVGDVVYVTDQNASVVVAFDKNTRARLGSFATKGSNPSQLSQPQGIVADSAGALYVADRLNQRIAVFAAESVTAETARPALTIASPSSGAVVPRGPLVMTGAASDGGSAVATVEVSLQDRATGLWWNAKTGMWQPVRVWSTAPVSGPTMSMQWRFAFNGSQADNTYDAFVRARDRANNFSPTVARTVTVSGGA